MARSDPARSDYCASRHLLRNLNQPRRLRRNPLAAGFFAADDDHSALARIRHRISRAFDVIDAFEAQYARRAARWVTILVRVDVERHDPSAVASDLGLSIRQFHRERRNAHDRFIAAYRTTQSQQTPILVEDKFDGRLLQRAVALADSGEVSSAQAILLDVARSADDGTRVEALAQLAESETWGHRLERAQAHLNDAKALFARANFSTDQEQRLRDVFEAAELRLRWFRNGPGSLHNGHKERRPGAHVTLLQAAALLRTGDAPHAAALLQNSEVEFGALDAASSVDLLILRAELADFTAEAPLLSEVLFERAISTAQANGLHGRELYARHQSQITRWAHTRNAADRSAYRALVDKIDRSLSPRLRSYLTFSAADIESAIGNPQRALDMAAASALVSTNAYETISAHGLAAGALLRLGRVAEAGAQAASSAHAARAAGFARIVSLSQRINAQALFAEGNRRAARGAIEESIECARHFSSAHALAQAQAVLARITGKIRSKEIPI